MTSERLDVSAYSDEWKDRRDISGKKNERERYLIKLLSIFFSKLKTSSLLLDIV